MTIPMIQVSLKIYPLQGHVSQLSQLTYQRLASTTSPPKLSHFWLLISLLHRAYDSLHISSFTLYLWVHLRCLQYFLSYSPLNISFHPSLISTDLKPPSYQLGCAKSYSKAAPTSSHQCFSSWGPWLSHTTLSDLWWISKLLSMLSRCGKSLSTLNLVES